MLIASRPDRSDETSEQFSQAEIIRTFEKLGLNDPATRGWLLGLSAHGEEPEPQHWTFSDSGTKHLENLTHSHAQLE